MISEGDLYVLRQIRQSIQDSIDALEDIQVPKMTAEEIDQIVADKHLIEARRDIDDMLEHIEEKGLVDHD